MLVFILAQLSNHSLLGDPVLVLQLVQGGVVGAGGAVFVGPSVVVGATVAVVRVPGSPGHDKEIDESSLCHSHHGSEDDEAATVEPRSKTPVLPLTTD